MKSKFLELLRCPESGQELYFIDAIENHLIDGKLSSRDGQYLYAIRNKIPRFVKDTNYADNFGLQWNYFAKTQLDSFSCHNISADRFWKSTGWSPHELKDKWVLDVGCGSGRFAEVALLSGANVVAFDFSSSVDACWSNLKHHPNLYVLQGDIYKIPLKPGTFDYVYALGVLQHTPDVRKAFGALPLMLRPGGKICVDYYEKTLLSKFLPKYWLRPFTSRMNQHQLFLFIKYIVPILLPFSRLLSRLPIAGQYLKRIVPVANHEGILPLSKRQLYEWSVLDTFDWLSPAYDNPQTKESAYRWCKDHNLTDIVVFKLGHLVVRAPKNNIYYE